MDRKKIMYGLTGLIILGLVVLSGCAPASASPEEPVSGEEPAGLVEEKTVTAPAWMDIELTDVTTGEVFKISDFRGTPVLMESFAVWCTTCLAQQKQIAKLHEIEGDAIIHISIDTDPNEDAVKVIDHAERHGFDWYFVISPVELTTALIDEFGLGVVIAPSAPVILINKDQSARLLRNGVKSSDDLLAEIKKSN